MFIGEIKVTRNLTLAQAFRAALGQLLEYGHLCAVQIVSLPSADSTQPRYVPICRNAIALYAVGLLAAFAFSQTFTTFVPWDDEGYFLQAYHDFLSGRVPYEQVFAPYGPFTFFSAAVVARFDAANVTHDTFRWALLPVWVAIASLLASIVWRWTGRFSGALVALLLVGFRLRGLPKSVGHPQLWIILAVAVLLGLGLDWVSRPGRPVRAFGMGVVVGVILLCKINVGAFVCLAVALGVSLQLRGRLRMIACLVFAAAAAGLGLALLLTGSVVSEKYFALAYLGSLAATLAIAMPRSVEQPASLKNLLWMAAGLGICLCVGVGVTLAYGTSLRGLFHALVTTPAGFASSYHNPFVYASRRSSILLSTIGLVIAAIGVFRWRSLARSHPEWLGLVKFGAGALLLCSFVFDQRLALAGSLLFMWLLLVDAQPTSGPTYWNRLLLALLCPLFSLQLFPMAGEQVDWAALPPIMAAAVLLADGTNCLLRGGLPVRPPRLISLGARVTAPLLTIFLFLAIGGKTLARFERWRTSQPVNLPGTHWLRLPPMEAARLTQTTGEVRRNCESVLTIPGLYSFPLWSGVPPAEEKRFNSWPFLWPDEVQKNVLPRLRQQSRGCVLVSHDTYDFFKQFAVSPGNDALLSEIQQTMRPITTVQDLTLYRSSGGQGIAGAH